MDKTKLKLPQKNGYCAMWYDGKGNAHMVSDSLRRTYKAAQKVADEYMFIHQVIVTINECVY